MTVMTDPSGDQPVSSSSARVPKPSKGQSPLNKNQIHARLTAEWRGGFDPPDPKRNIHEPSEFLNRLLKEVGMSDGIEQEKLKEAWSSIAGEFIARHTVPDSIKNGVLVLRVLQPAMKFHLQQMSGKLLENLHNELGSGAVKQVVFKIG